MTMGRPGLSAATKSYQQSIKVLEILQQNTDGLTSLQIGILLGEGIGDSILYRLQKAGKIRQKNALLASGIGYVYVLNTSK